MKNAIIILLLAFGAANAQVKNGEKVSDIEFATILNAPVKSAYLKDLKNKVVIIDFWATWCGSCIAAMPHLNELQKKFGDKLRIITVTDETVGRTKKFLAARPSKLWFAVDTARTLAALFPHQLLPHTILISPSGKLIASTSPELITDEVIEKVSNNEAVLLEEKKDVIVDHDELIQSMFPASDTVINRFIMKSPWPGAGGMSTTWRSNKTFAGRRITCINVDLKTLYLISYNNFPYSRMIDSSAKNRKDESYCLDLIVENKEDLMPRLRKELSSRFDLQVRMDKKERPVYFLQIADAGKFKLNTLNTDGTRTYTSGHGYIDQKGISMVELAEYLESYGSLKLPVIDKTMDDRKFDIRFSFEPENPESIFLILEKMGIKLVKSKADVEMLVLYK